MGPCVGLVAAISPEPPVCLTPVSPQTQLLGTNGEGGKLSLCSGWQHGLTLPLLFALLSAWRCVTDLGSAQVHSGGTPRGKGGRVMLGSLH